MSPFNSHAPPPGLFLDQISLFKCAARLEQQAETITDLLSTCSWLLHLI